MLTATLRHMQWMSDNWGGGTHSEHPGGFLPYFGVDRAISQLVRGERDRTLDYFCAYTDTAGGTFSWGEGYSNLIAAGDQPHNWADVLWILLYRDLFAFEDDSSLWITPALFRRWHEPGQHVAVSRLPTHFGELDLKIEPRPTGNLIEYTVRVVPKGDQANRPLDRIVLYPRTPSGRAIRNVTLDGRVIREFTRDTVIIASPKRDAEMHVSVQTESW